MTRSLVYFAPAAGTEAPDSLSHKARSVFLRTGFAEALAPEDFVALKLHFGEKGNTGYLKPAWLRGLSDEVRKRTPRAFLTDSNTLYTGARSNSVEHVRLAWSHGFTPAALDLPVIIADGLTGHDAGEAEGRHGRVRTAKIAGAFLVSDALLCLSHVTGHVQTGLGAALKNLGMGCASRAGKLAQHAVVHPRVNAKTCRNCSTCFDHCPAGAIVQAEGHVVIDGKTCTGCGECLIACKFGAIRIAWDSDSRRLQEKVAEYALLVGERFAGKIVFLNFLIQVTKDCDCMAKKQPRIVEDIGILASTDPVAIDQASADLVLAKGGDAFRAGYDIDWSVQLRHGEAIGLGRTDYDLVEVG
jgi:hypothetical protein